MKLRILGLILLALPCLAQAETRPAQFVQIAFDGSYRIDAWEQTRNLARELSTPRQAVHFTYFINSVYLLGKPFRKEYTPPVGPVGTANLEFPANLEDIKSRVRQINLAIDEGHEIASHTAGHFIGFKFTEAQWQREFEQFNKLLFKWVENNRFDAASSPVLNLKPEDIIGFRAPGLGTSPGLYTTLRQHNFQYDTSKTAKPGKWPQKVDGLWLYPLALLKMADSNPPRWTYSMDYNFFLADTNLQDISKLVSSQEGRARLLKQFGTDQPGPVAQVMEDRAYKTMLDYFEASYHGNRAPVHIGFHFTPFQGGVYWRALVRFAHTVAGLPEVRLASYRELTQFMNSLTPEQLGAFDKADFPLLPKTQATVTLSPKPTLKQN